MITTRRLAALALIGPLTGAGLLLAAAPAYAEGSITAPGDGVVYTSPATVQIKASLSGRRNAETQLNLTTPGGSASVVARSPAASLGGSATMEYALDTDSAVNGTWRVTLTGGAAASSSFVLRIAPRAPESVAARADGYRAVVVSWRKGTEPDLTGWTLYGDGGVLQDGIGTSACSGTTCSTTVTYAEDGTGEHTYAVTSRRSAGPGSDETIESPRSSEVSATLESPPPPPPSPPAEGGGSTGGTTGGTGGTTGGSTGDTTGGTAGGTTGGGTGGTSDPTGGSTGGTSDTTAGTSGGGTGTSASGQKPSGSDGITTSSKPAAAIAQRRAFALTFKAFGPKLGIPKLPPLPATQPVVAAPLPDGTYEKTLGYKPVTKREKISTPKAAASRVTGAVGSALDSEQFVRSVAGALVLLLTAAHLRRWLGAHEEQ